jgi:short subunit dehydrogenase-like uncharacterized protein
MAKERPYDLICFGATGFTGRLVAEYLAGKTDETFRWAVAARSPKKLAQLRDELRLIENISLLRADSHDPASLLAMAQQTRVVLSMVGPYALHGLPLVAACVEAGTDYVDITGEPRFADAVLEAFGASARERGVRIVNCCGFDSIPPDLGVFMVARELPEDCPVLVEGFMTVRTPISGGTWQSAIGAMGMMRDRRRAEPPTTGRRVVQLAKSRPHYEKAVNGWVVPLPTVDAAVVLRSAQALPFYGREFRYAHYLRMGSLPNLLGKALGVGVLAGLAQFKPTRELLLKMRKSGDGPSEQERANSFFRLLVRGTAGNRQVLGEVRGPDPGYGSTARMAAESALCLALDRASLPEGYGVLTPAVAMDERLLERLRRAELTFEIISVSDRKNKD